LNGEKLSRTFYSQPTLEVARNILGKFFVRKINEKILAGRIVEVEAYHQDGDRASHSFRGKTARNEVMFGESGYLYVYFTYGMHFCMNIVTEEKDVGAAVLIRAIEPIVGIEMMKKNRGEKIQLHNLTNGPAKCCQAFSIARSENGTDLSGNEIYILDAPRISNSFIERSMRIGINDSVELLWRFFIKGNQFVSKG
jgi:DNA-3-methyladenine glycosylase